MPPDVCFEDVFHALPEGALLTGADCTILSANPAFLRIVGRQASETVGRKCSQVFEGPLCGTMRCPLEIVRNEKKARLFDGRDHCKVAGRQDRIISAAPVFDAQGHFRAMVETMAAPAVSEQLRAPGRDGMRKIMGAVIQAMSTTIEKRDPYTAGHQRRVAKLCRAIATVMGFSWDRVQGLRMAAAIHDLGKILVPAAILNKPGPMSEHEMAIIRLHPCTAYDILKGIDFPWPLAETIHQHHERLDGSGYPRKLKGEQILLEARILAVADVVESMASFRPYREALNLDVALGELRRHRGVRYDARVVDICVDLIEKKGFDFRTKAWQGPAEKRRTTREGRDADMESE